MGINDEKIIQTNNGWHEGDPTEEVDQTPFYDDEEDDE